MYLMYNRINSEVRPPEEKTRKKWNERDQSFMTFLEKTQSFLILAAVLVGLALGKTPAVAENAALFVKPLLMLMLTGVFLHVPLGDFGRAFQFRGLSSANLVINFVWAPLFAWTLGWLFLSEHPALWIGLIMLMVTPCTDGLASNNRLRDDLLRIFESETELTCRDDVITMYLHKWEVTHEGACDQDR